MSASAPRNDVGVVIPCYAQERYLGEAIESVLAQTVPVDEILVVDDGSPGDPAAVVARYPDVRLVRQANAGISEARNTGLRESRSRYLIFLDADDRLLPNAVSAGLAGFAAHPDAALIAGLCRRIDEKGAPRDLKVQFVCPGGDHYDALLRHNHIWPPAVGMYRRECLEAIDGWTWKRHVQDLELYLRLARKYAIHCHPEEVAEYRIQESGRSQNRGRMLAGMMDVLRLQKPYIAEHPEYREAFREGWRRYPTFYGEQLVAEIRGHYRAGRWRDVAAGFADLFRHYPLAARDLVVGRMKSLLRGLTGTGR
ncbi:MAG TPA: glycosyltransferase family A protein [Gemmatimonadales bacterium]|nr:glycosyltransferase family A protein [Gemmatimonadales bacterium]